jgi:hypothetical protein
MHAPDKLVPTRRIVALPLFCLGLIVAGFCLSGCATGNTGGKFPMSFDECMNPANPLPWWQTYPCSAINTGGTP